MAFDGFRKIRCPFCAKEYRLGEFAIYSETAGAVAKEAPKTTWQRFTSGVRVQPLEGKENTLARNLRQCPNCGGVLPFNIEYVEDNITIAVIGDSYSGKSHLSLSWPALMLRLRVSRQNTEMITMTLCLNVMNHSN